MRRVLGIILGLLVLLAVLTAIVLPSEIFGRSRDNERYVVGNLRSISSAEMIFRDADKDQNGKLDYGTLDALHRVKLVDDVLGSGTSHGYIFLVQPGADAEKQFWAVARPKEPGSTGNRVYFMNQTGVICSLPCDDKNASALPDPKTCDPPPNAVPVR